MDAPRVHGAEGDEEEGGGIDRRPDQSRGRDGDDRAPVQKGPSRLVGEFRSEEGKPGGEGNLWRHDGGDGGADDDCADGEGAPPGRLHPVAQAEGGADDGQGGVDADAGPEHEEAFAGVVDRFRDVHVDPVDVHRRGDVAKDEQPAKHVVWIPV